MKSRTPWHIKPAFRYLCEHTNYDGFEIGIGNFSKEEQKQVHAKLIDALELIRRIDPRRYRYLQRDVRRIMVFEGRPGYRGMWYDADALCHLSANYIAAPTTKPELVAAIIIHEAMHGRLYRWGFGYEEEQRMRIEHICLKSEIAFARRLPLSEKTARKTIMSNARILMEKRPEEWSDRGQLEHTLRACERAKWPDWLVALTRRSGLKQIARAEAARARRSAMPAVGKAEEPV